MEKFEYIDANTAHNIVSCIQNDECVFFAILDASDNDMRCKQDNGGYSVTLNMATYAKRGDFASRDIIYFGQKN